MAKNKKPKFLEKETPELLALLKEILSAGEDADTKKALKVTEELISRLPSEEGLISVDEALKAAAEIMTEALNKVKGAYENEISMMEDFDEAEDSDEAVEVDDEEEEEEAPKTKKSKKTAKKSKKQAEPEPEEDEEDEDSDEDEDSYDEDDEDYSDWSIKNLKMECRTRGIKVTKGMAKADMVKALEADDKE
nr:MAG TPA: HeH/LEM domain [Caudoviricetes sp.]